jgi:hypothetical protein
MENGAEERRGKQRKKKNGNDQSCDISRRYFADVLSDMDEPSESVQTVKAPRSATTASPSKRKSSQNNQGEAKNRAVSKIERKKISSFFYPIYSLFFFRLPQVEVHLGDGTVRQLRVKAEREYDPLMVSGVRIPLGALSRSWALPIVPYKVPVDVTSQVSYFQKPVLEFSEEDLSKRSLKYNFQAILMDPPWNPLLQNHTPFSADMLVRNMVKERKKEKRERERERERERLIEFFSSPSSATHSTIESDDDRLCVYVG